MGFWSNVARRGSQPKISSNRRMGRSVRADRSGRRDSPRHRAVDGSGHGGQAIATSRRISEAASISARDLTGSAARSAMPMTAMCASSAARAAARASVSSCRTCASGPAPASSWIPKARTRRLPLVDEARVPNTPLGWSRRSAFSIPMVRCSCLPPSRPATTRSMRLIPRAMSRSTMPHGSPPLSLSSKVARTPIGNWPGAT